MSIAGRIAALPVLASARAWFDGRTSREQLLLGGLAIVGMAALLVLGVWRPLTTQRETALSEIARYDGVLARVRLAGASGLKPAAGLSGGTATPAPSIAGAAADHGLLVRRIEPDGDYTRIVFENANFARILDWIAATESASIARVAAIQMDRRPEPGFVNVQVTLED